MTAQSERVVFALAAGPGARQRLYDQAEEAGQSLSEFIRARLDLPAPCAKRGRPPRKRPLPDEVLTA